MKKLVLFMSAALLTTILFAQTAKYEAAMLKNIVLLDSFSTDMQQLSANFKRIGDAEKTQALPYYYAAFAKLSAIYKMKVVAEKATAITEADSLLAKAKALGLNNSETATLEGMVLTSQMQTEPNRMMELGPKSSAAFAKAIQMDANNPRPVMLLAINTFYTPEQFGGGKVKAQELAAKAEALFNTFKPASSLEPTWGKGMFYGYLKPLVSK
jgi:hypothetical protein